MCALRQNRRCPVSTKCACGFAKQVYAGSCAFPRQMRSFDLFKPMVCWMSFVRTRFFVWIGLVMMCALAVAACTSASGAGSRSSLPDGGEEAEAAETTSWPDAGAPGAPDAGAVPGEERDAGTVVASDAGSTQAGGADGGATDAGPGDTSIRFIALGDSGKGNEGQRKVAQAMLEVCQERGGCGFALMLGDNIYDTGVDDINDEQWQEKFELPYADLDFPFFSTLGNHDYGAPPIVSFLGGIGIDPRRGEAQVEYSNVSEKFIMPDTHYRFTQGPIDFVSLNTTSMFWADLGWVESAAGFDDENDRMLADLTTWAAESTSPWRIAFGHHPYLSNGPHGNAGRYDGVSVEGLVGSGTEIRNFMESHIIGHFDVYLCGHDHSLQDLGRVNGTELFVSGGGASHTDLSGENAALWQRARRGFLLVEGDAQELTFTFVEVPDDEDAASGPWHYAHSRTISRYTR